MPREPRRPGLGNLTQKPFLEKGENAGRKSFYIGSNKLAGPEDCLEGGRKLEGGGGGWCIYKLLRTRC